MQLTRLMTAWLWDALYAASGWGLGPGVCKGVWSGGTHEVGWIAWCSGGGAALPGRGLLPSPHWAPDRHYQHRRQTADTHLAFRCGHEGRCAAIGTICVSASGEAAAGRHQMRGIAVHACQGVSTTRRWRHATQLTLT